MKFVTREVPRTFVEIDGKEFSYNTLYEVLDELECTDTYSTILIYNQDLEQVLTEREVANKNIRGSCYRGKNYISFYEEFETALEVFREQS